MNSLLQFTVVTQFTIMWISLIEWLCFPTSLLLLPGMKRPISARWLEVQIAAIVSFLVIFGALDISILYTPHIHLLLRATTFRAILVSESHQLQPMLVLSVHWWPAPVGVGSVLVIMQVNVILVLIRWSHRSSPDCVDIESRMVNHISSM